MSDSSKPPTTDKERAQRAAQYVERGGLVLLRGGYWDSNVLWQDEWDRLPDGSTKRVGYTRTEEIISNPLGYGEMRVYRYDG